MSSGAVIERVRRIAEVRGDLDADRSGLEAGLGELTAVRAWCDAAEADLVRRLAATVSFPEAAIADSTRDSLHRAGRTLDRSKTLDDTPRLADALEHGAITAGHVDSVTRTAATLDGDQRDELVERCDALADVAARATIDQWAHRVRELAQAIQRDDGIDRLARQQRATSLSTWVDNEGMWNLRGRFDPKTGVSLAARLDAAVEALFADTTPPSAPNDPIARQQHLRALALARLVDGAPAGSKPGRPEYVAVIDTAGDPNAGWQISWPIPIELPTRVVAQLIGDGDVDVVPVVVRNGVVLYAPGELDLGRTTRLANRAQRRALRAMYPTCPIPGCTVGFDHCTIHHVIWWRRGGRTDLANLLPVCTAHHGRIHHDGWIVTLGPDRELRVELPDGTIMATGPPTRRAA